MSIIEMGENKEKFLSFVSKVLREENPTLTLSGQAIIKNDETLFGLLEYDNSITVKFNYSLSDAEFFVTPENVIIPREPEITFINFSDSFTETEQRLIGKLTPEREKTEHCTVRISSWSNLSVKQQISNTPYSNYQESQPEIAEIVNSLGFKIANSDAHTKRTSLSKENIISILDWMKKEMEYKELSKLPDDWTKLKALNARFGACEQLSSIFCSMVHATGGLSEKINSKFSVNFNLEGFPYFSRSESNGGPHSLARAYFDNQWQYVDPTIYITTYKNEKIPAGIEMRALNQIIKNYHVVEGVTPRLVFLNKYKAPNWLIKSSEISAKNAGRPYKEYSFNLGILPTIQE